jgi:hypothetical protein
MPMEWMNEWMNEWVNISLYIQTGWCSILEFSAVMKTVTVINPQVWMCQYNGTYIYPVCTSKNSRLWNFCCDVLSHSQKLQLNTYTNLEKSWMAGNIQNQQPGNLHIFGYVHIIASWLLIL